MKLGRSIGEFEAELQRQNAAKRDFRSPTRDIEAVVVENGDGSTHPRLRLGGVGTFEVNQTAHGDLSGYTDVPKRYYDRMLETAPALWAENVNHWLAGKDEVRLVRTLDERVRAVLSNRYRMIDNFDVISKAVAPILRGFEGLNIQSTEITERRMYLKATLPRITMEPKKGDVVQAGICISNSEVGSGMFKVEPLLFRLVCLNGMILPDAAMRRFHLGRKTDDVAEAYEIYRDETLAADDHALMLKIQDTVRAAFDEVRFRAIAERLSEAAERPLAVPAQTVVEEVAKQYKLTEMEKGGLFFNLSQTPDQNQWGLANAITSLANVTEDYQRATDLEVLGGNIVSLDSKEWKALAG